MPNLVTHYLLAKKVYEEEVDGDKNSFLYGHFQEFCLGTQGPDILFYTYFAPLHLHPKLAKFNPGDVMHKESGAKLFSLLAEELSTIEDKEEHDSFASYALGCLAHLILDRETHPFTYYMTGFDKNHLVRHSRLESAYATYQCQHDLERKRLLTHPWEVLPYDKAIVKRLDSHFVRVMDKYFNREFPKHPLREGCKTYRLMMRYCASGGVKIIPVSIAKALRMPESVGEDCVNSTHRVWKNPEDGRERTESFLDLYDRAVSLVASAYTSLQKEGFDFSVFSRYLNELNYEGYHPGSRMKFHSPDQLREKW